MSEPDQLVRLAICELADVERTRAELVGALHAENADVYILGTAVVSHDDPMSVARRLAPADPIWDRWSSEPDTVVVIAWGVVYADGS